MTKTETTLQPLEKEFAQAEVDWPRRLYANHASDFLRRLNCATGNRTPTFFSLAIATSCGAKRSSLPANQALGKVLVRLNLPCLAPRNAIGLDSRCIGNFGR